VFEETQHRKQPDSGRPQTCMLRILAECEDVLDSADRMEEKLVCQAWLAVMMMGFRDLGGHTQQSSAFAICDGAILCGRGKSISLPPLEALLASLSLLAGRLHGRT
jgi:hypothetical protein